MPYAGIDFGGGLGIGMGTPPSAYPGNPPGFYNTAPPLPLPYVRLQ